MYPVSGRFLDALRTSHRIVTRVDAYYDGVLTAPDLPIADGAVTVDRGSKTRRSLSLTIADPSFLPWSASDPLAVYGQQLVVSRGIRFTDGTTETVPLGTFRVEEPSGDTKYGPVTVSGKSLECAIIDDTFQVPTTTRGYSGCVDAITSMIHQTLPSATILNQTAGTRNPACAVAVWDAGADRWDAVVKIARAMQAEIYVDVLNRFVIRDLPNVLTDPVAWEIAEGEGGTLMASAKTMSRTAVFNAVVASGENTAGGAAPATGVARDMNPLSPTLWGGPFGKVTKFISSSLWTTNTACQAAAEFALFDAVAPNISTTIDSIPNPALEGNDVLRVLHAGRAERFLLQSCTIPLTADGDFTVALRSGKEDDA